MGFTGIMLSSEKPVSKDYTPLDPIDITCSKDKIPEMEDRCVVAGVKH
jgi:hypothetical protein